MALGNFSLLQPACAEGFGLIGCARIGGDFEDFADGGVGGGGLEIELVGVSVGVGLLGEVVLEGLAGFGALMGGELEKGGMDSSTKKARVLRALEGLAGVAV